MQASQYLAQPWKQALSSLSHFFLQAAAESLHFLAHQSAETTAAVKAKMVKNFMILKHR